MHKVYWVFDHCDYVGASGQSARSTDRAALSTDRAALLKYLLVAQQSVDRATIGRSRNNRSIAQQSIDRATIGRSRNNRSIAQYTAMNMRDQAIVQEWRVTIGRLCRNGSARSTDFAGMVMRDRPILQDVFGAIGRCSGVKFTKM